MIPAAALDFPSPINCNPSLGFANFGKCLTGITQGVASDAFSSIAAAFAKAADSTINWLWQQMSTATAVHLGGTAFNQLFDVALAVAVVLAVGIFAAQMCVSALRHDPAGISRAAVGLVLMGVGGGAAVAITDLLLQAVDAVSAGVLQVTTGDTIAQMGNSLLASGSITASTTNPAGLILISLFALAAVVMVWLALTVRKMLVIVAAVLAPFAFAGSVADFSRSWVRRWVEIVVALVFSKLILMFVFVIGLFVLIRGVGSTGTGAAQGITQTVLGILILALAGFSPWVAIKMAHFAGHNLEGMHTLAGGATAGATTVQSMARPLGAALVPGASVAGMAGGLASSAKPWSPQTTATAPGRTNMGPEAPTSPAGSSPSRNSANMSAAAAGGAATAGNHAAGPGSPNGSTQGSDGPTTSDEGSPPPTWATGTDGSPAPPPNGNRSTRPPPSGRRGSDPPWSSAPASTNPREPDFWQSGQAACNTTPGWDSPTPPPPPPSDLEGGSPQ